MSSRSEPDGLDLDALKALTADASEGPWEAADDGLVWAPRLGDPVSGSTEMADAAFIAAARTAVPALIAEVERLRGELYAARHELIEFRERHVLTHAKMDQLRYERRLLGFARLVLDQVAAGDASRWDQARNEAADIAQRIVDEIGHPVTDEPALGPGFREQIAALTAERDRRGDELRRAQAVVDAAKAWRDARPGPWVSGADVEFHLFAAVDALRSQP